MLSKGILSIILLICANVFMTLAWYGHLKFSWFKPLEKLPLGGIILISWGIALVEYCFQVPANRIGYKLYGGPFEMIQLKMIQEVITLVIFVFISTFLFKENPIRWNHLVAFVLLVLAVYFVFKK
ncbi:MAG: DMT family protein [Saprospiraceae bacterium]|nr:DMT family protein [Saprospiraceae bacterium]